jgi:hyperosmotically inducible protein
MDFLRFTASALLTCGLAATYTFAAEDNTTESKSVSADIHAKDQRITHQIRKAIMEDVSLSAGGNNVGIMTTEGKVVLRGTVRSEYAKAEIEKHAVNVVGSISNVTSELKVVAAK